MRKLINTILVELSQFRGLSLAVSASGGQVCKSVGGRGC